jgi:hypothetical protein
MNFLKQLIGDGDQPSTMRVIVLAIVLPVMFVWAWLCIKKGEFIAPPWEIIATLVAAVLGKSAQSFAEAIGGSGSDAKTQAAVQTIPEASSPMGKILPLLLLAAGLASVCAPGCATKLAPGGAYSPAITNANGQVILTERPDLKLFAADAAFQISHSAVDTAFRLERENRELLWQLSPSIKHKLDEIRPRAQMAVRKWAIARKAYLAAPVPANLSQLEAALAEMQRLSAVATTLLPQPE